MFRNIAAVGNDVLVRGSKQVGSLLIEQMKVGGPISRRLPARQIIVPRMAALAIIGGNR
jgi:hypothetical protein